MKPRIYKHKTQWGNWVLEYKNLVIGHREVETVSWKSALETLVEFHRVGIKMDLGRGEKDE